MVELGQGGVCEHATSRRIDYVHLTGHRALMEVRMRAMVVLALAWAGCAGDKDEHDHEEGPICSAISEACHEPGEAGDVEAEACHEIAHAADETACEAERDRCVDYCTNLDDTGT
jgi:hypothetical protein